MRDYALLVVFVGLIPFVLVRPWIGVLVWSWIGFMNPHKLGYGFTHSLPVAMVFGGLTIGLMFLTKDKKGVPITRETIILLLLAILFTVSSAFAWEPQYAWPEWDKVMKILLFTFVTMVFIYGKERIHALFVVIAVSIGFFGFKGGLFAIRTGGHNHVIGPVGSFIEANTALGLAMLMVLPMIVMLARHAGNKWLKRFGYVSAGLTCIAIIFTYSRGALVGLAAISPLLFLKARKKALVLLLLVPVAWVGPDLLPKHLVQRAGTIETYQQDNSAMQRIQAWGVAWNVALSSPLVGAGFKLEDTETQKWMSYAMFKGDWPDQSARAAHSVYFQMLGEQGFTGLILFVLLLVFSLMTLARVKKAAKDIEGNEWMTDYATALQIGLIAFAVSGAFLSLAYFDLFYSFVALAVIMKREVETTAPAAGTARVGFRSGRLPETATR